MFETRENNVSISYFAEQQKNEREKMKLSSSIMPLQETTMKASKIAASK